MIEAALSKLADGFKGEYLATHTLIKDRGRMAQKVRLS